ncbi:nuclear transport factor 2 family protein [Nocardioides sp. L-11A]|uniref:nuclear transport factor 2 family protein n=1 Tax=Nocardioides sp. L-11A TaxID=3043848 RepID=UPI00249BADB1|nr:nuclear transport factor 2 family protein [Nocardioides sp. L-11A]
MSDQQTTPTTPTRRDVVAGCAAEWSRRSQAGDFDGMLALAAPGMTAWQSGGEPPSPFVEAIEGIRTMHERMGQWQYLHPRLIVDDHGFCEQHVVRFARADGSTRDFTACVVAEVDENGLISRLDEYLDPARNSTWVA